MDEASLIPPPDVAAAPSRLRTRLIGVLMVLASGIGFSTKAILVKVAYRFDVDAVSLLTLRMGFSLPFFVAAYLRVSRQRGVVRGRDVWNIVALGILGYYLAALFDFMGLKYVSAALERLILFVYPTLVLAIGALLYRVRVRKHQLLALGLTYLGIALAFGGELATYGSNVPLGASLIFGAALTYAVYLVGAGRMVPRLGAERFTALALIVACLTTILHCAATGRSVFGLPKEVYGLSLLLAVLSTVMPAFLLTKGIALLGSGPASIVSGIGPVSTIVLAYFVLGEPISLAQLCGTALVLGGAVLIARHG